MLQPNTTISSTQNIDFSIKEKNRKEITEETIKKFLGRTSKTWKTSIPLGNFAQFDSVVLSQNIKSFVHKLNEISSKAPSFDLISFLQKEIVNINQNFATYDDYYNKFLSDLNNEFQKVKYDLDNKIISVLSNKSLAIFSKFNIKNPNQTNSYNKLIKDINDHKNSIDPKWNFIQDNLKKMIDNLEADKNNSYQIEGLTGFYNKVNWDKEFNAFFNNVGKYNPTTADDFAKIVIPSIVDDYKERLKNLINNNQKTFEYRNLVEILKNNSKKLDILGQIDSLFPGSKAIIENIQKHSDNKEYGGFRFSYSSLSENMKLINTSFAWTYNDQNYMLINENSPVKNSKSDVQKAIQQFKEDSLSKNVKINSSLDFSFRALANATGKNMGQIYNDLTTKKIGEMTISEFLKFTKNSGKEYKEFKKIIDDIANSTNTNNNKLNVGFKITYQIDDLNTDNLLLKLVIRDKGFPKPDINNKDQIDSVNLTKATGDKNSLPQISIKLISKEISSLLASAKFKIGQQDFIGYDPNSNNRLDIAYLKTLPINKIVNGKIYINLGSLMQKYINLGINLNDIEIFSVVQMKKDAPNSYSINFFVTDKSLSGYKHPSDTRGSFGAIKVISLQEQLEKINILKLLNEYSGRPNSVFDTKKLTPTIDGPSVSDIQINNSLKLNDQNSVSPKSNQNIIDRIKDIFNSQNKIDKLHELDFAKPFPYTIKWITQKTNNVNITGHGLIWNFKFKGVSAFDFNQTTSLNSGDYNVVYEFTAATLLDKEISKQNVREYGNNIIDTINKNPLVTEEKRILASKAIDEINNIINQYANLVDTNSSDWSKIRLKKEEDDAILKITKISNILKENVGSSSIIQEISKIIGRALTEKEVSLITKHAELFADLLDITKDKKVIGEILKNKELADKLAKIAGKPIFEETLKTLLKVKDNYQYAYLGVGIVSGVAGLAGAGAFISSLRANRRIKKMNGKQAKIKGSKLISIITAFVTIGSIATSIVTLLWFFISKGGM